MSLRSLCIDTQYLNRTIDLTTADAYEPSSSSTLKDILSRGQFNYPYYSDSLFISSVGWLGLAGVALIIYIAFVLNGIWIRRKGQSIWICCRRPKTVRYQKYYMIIGLFFSVCMFAGCITGLVLGRNNNENGKAAACSILELSDRINEGSTGDNWGGITKSAFSYNWASVIFAEEAPLVYDTFETDMTNVTLKVNEYIDDIDVLYSVKNHYYVYSADISDPRTSQIEPSFIAELGPRTQAGTFMDSLVQETSVLSEKVEESAQGLTVAVPEFIAKTPAIQAELLAAKDSYAVFGQVLGNFTLAISSFVKNSYDNLMLKHGLVTLSFSLLLGFSVVLFGTIIAYHKKKIQDVSQFSYIVWHLIMIWVVVSAYLVSELVILQKRTKEHCDLFNTLVSDQDFTTSLGTYYTEDFSKPLATCFFAEGDTFRAVGLEDGGVLIDKMAKYVDEIAPYIEDGPGSLEVKAQQEIIDMYIYGLILASDDTSDSMSSKTNLDNMNSWSNSNGTSNNQLSVGQCNITKDEWVFNATNCTKERTWNPIYRPADFFGEDICIDIWSLDSGTIRQRYLDWRFADCEKYNGETIAKILQDQYDGLNRHFVDVKTKFTKLKTYYEFNFKWRYDEIVKTASNITKHILAFNDSLKITLDYVAGPEHGILYNSNCSFLKRDILITNDYICGLNSSIEKTFFTLAVATCSGVLCGFFIYLYFRNLEVKWKPIPRVDFKKEAVDVNQIMPEIFIPEGNHFETGPLDETDHAIEEKIEI